MTPSNRPTGSGWSPDNRTPPSLDEVRELFNAGMATKDKRALLEDMRAITLDFTLGVDGAQYDPILKLIDDALNAL